MSAGIAAQGRSHKGNLSRTYSSETFEKKYTYTGLDLGAVWSREKTAFRVWAPTAGSVMVKLYRSGTEGTEDLLEQIPMAADEKGTWVAQRQGDLNGVYYTYLVEVEGVKREVCDPYARTTGVNGKRAMILDLASTDPEGWETDADPHAGIPMSDVILYELHIRDLSSHESAGIRHVGKFLGLTETGTKTPGGTPTGLDHIKGLGITHLHILPMFDFGSVDESRLDLPQFNWGYDPVNFNVPEGSYSTDPCNGAVRVRELKQMVQALHQNGISVVMDVVYNHVYDADSFCFNRIVPRYFSRVSSRGVYSNGSGCGNDTASERSMVRKYIVDSVSYWADEYHIDGFRFDLVGLLDVQTINELMAEVHKKHPNVIFYGEGWSLPTAVTKKNVALAVQANAHRMPGFAFFSDGFRDCVRGSVFDDPKPGFVGGAQGMEYATVKNWMALPGWTGNPSQVVNYASCHDNLTLIDKILSSTPGASWAEQVRMNRLAAAMTLTAQGIPFFQAGEELLRTKPNIGGRYEKPDLSPDFVNDSFNCPDIVNGLRWYNLDDPVIGSVAEYYRGLIALRKAHPALRLPSHEEVMRHVRTMPENIENLILFYIEGSVKGERADALYLIFHAGKTPARVTLPYGKWNVYVNGQRAGTEILDTVSGTITVEPICAMVLAQED